MSRDGVGVVILAEDIQTECFIRRFLVRRGLDRRHIRTETSPQGQGAGEQWVRERFINELKAYRSRATRAATCLIVASDADSQTVQKRIQTFRLACIEAKVQFRNNDERVAFIVPQRNIETWLAYLREETVDEAATYPKYPKPSDCRSEVARLDEMCRKQNHEGEPPSSLESACVEFARLGV